MDRKVMSEFNDFQRQDKIEVWSKEFLFASVGIFLCITSSLTLITVVSNFALAYQARTMLFEMITVTSDEPSTRQSLPISTTDPTFMETITTAISSGITGDPSSLVTQPVTTQTSSTEVSIDTSTPKVNMSTVSTSQWTEEKSTVTPVTSQRPTQSSTDITTSNLNLSTPQLSSEPEWTSTLAPVTSQRTSTIEISPPIASEPSESPTTSSATTAVTPKAQNPVSILATIHHRRVVYKCSARCNSPPVITAQLNLSLSFVGNNFLVLTLPTKTKDKKVAQRKVAYLALTYLHEERLNESLVDEEWSLPVPPESTCNTWDGQWGEC